MATQVQFRRGTTAETANFIGAIGEITVDLTKQTCVIHDAIQLGGCPLLREDGSNSALAPGTLSNCSLKFVGDPSTGFISPGPQQLSLVTGGFTRIGIDASGAVSIPGNLIATGPVSLSNSVQLVGTVPLTGDLSLTGTGTVIGTLNVTGTTALTGGLSVSGNVSLTGTGYLDLPVGTSLERPGVANSGMIRFNTTLNTFEGHDGVGWGSIGGGASGAGSDDIFYENGLIVTGSYTLTPNKNAMSAGPITINSGVTVTIPSGQSWVIV
jgi:hypothetical protein